MRRAGLLLVPLVLLLTPSASAATLVGERTCFLDPELRPVGLVCAEASLEGTLDCAPVPEGQLCSWEVTWRVHGDGLVPGTLQWKHLGPEPTQSCLFLPGAERGCGTQGSFVEGPFLVRPWGCLAFSHALTATAWAGVPHRRNQVFTQASALLVEQVGAC